MPDRTKRKILPRFSIGRPLDRNRFATGSKGYLATINVFSDNTSQPWNTVGLLGCPTAAHSPPGVACGRLEAP